MDGSAKREAKISQTLNEIKKKLDKELIINLQKIETSGREKEKRKSKLE